MRRTVTRVTGGLVALTLATAPGVASAEPGVGPRETADLTFTSVLPNSPSGFHYVETFRNSADPQGDPPALRGMAIEGPAGGRVDTSAAPRCTATDAQLKQQGEAACPGDSRIGAGTTTLAMDLFGRQSFAVGIFNAPSQELDVVKSGPQVVAVVRDVYEGNGFSNVVPTCIAGGQPPDGCPSDQARIVSSDFAVPPIVSGSGPDRRSLLTTPPACPESGAWASRMGFRYADGVTETVVSHQPCTRPGLRFESARRGERCRRSRAVGLTGRDLREVEQVEFSVDGRPVARDATAPFGATVRQRSHRRTVVAVVRAHGAVVATVQRTVRACGSR